MPESEISTIADLCSEETINELVIRSNSTFSTREYINNMYSHLCCENEVVSNKLLELVIADVCNSECTFVNVINHTPLLVNISKINDSFAPARMAFLMQNLFEKSFHEEYRTYIKYSDSILNLVLQIVRRNVHACRYLREMPNPLKYIEKFNNKNPLPFARGSSQSLFRNLSGDNIEKQVSEADKDTIREFNELRLQVFKDLLIDVDWEQHVESYVEKEGEEKADDERIYAKGEHIDYLKEEYKHWIDAQILEDYGPVAQVSYVLPPIVVKNSRTDVKKPSVKINKDNVRPSGVYTRDVLTQINSLYEYLYNKAVEDEKTRGRGYGGHYRY